LIADDIADAEPGHQSNIHSARTCPCSIVTVGTDQVMLMFATVNGRGHAT
jgi:hypothetical protein